MGDPGISITCPWCRKRFRVHGGSGGRQFRCPTPGCDNTLTVPPTMPAAAEPGSVSVLPLAASPCDAASGKLRHYPEPPTGSFDFDDEPAPPPRSRSKPRPRPQPEALDLDDEPPRSRAGLWVGLAAVAALVLLTGSGAVYWYNLRGGKATAGDGEPGGGGGGIVATGPRVVLREKPPESVKVRRYYVAGEFRDIGDPPPDDWEQTLPTGTERIHVGVELVFIPPNGTRMEVVLERAGGPLDEPKGTQFYQVEGGGRFLWGRLCTHKDGPFPDGQYRAKVSIDGKPAADLNFAIGARPELVAAAGLKGSRWALTKFGTTTRYEFGADGTFTVTANGGPSVRTGRWEAKGTAFAASVDRAGDRGRVEYRGDCLKDELRVRTREEQRDFDKKDGGFRADPGGWHPLGVLKRDAGKGPAGNAKGAAVEPDELE